MILSLNQFISLFQLIPILLGILLFPFFDFVFRSFAETDVVTSSNAAPFDIVAAAAVPFEFVTTSILA